MWGERCWGRRALISGYTRSRELLYQECTFASLGQQLLRVGGDSGSIFSEQLMPLLQPREQHTYPGRYTQPEQVATMALNFHQAQLRSLSSVHSTLPSLRWDGEHSWIRAFEECP